MPNSDKKINQSSKNITQELFQKDNTKIVLLMLYKNLQSSTNLCLQST